jgi:16S rRNA (adenine1518-N6/adenine1519-N6)-dimethyltransferase
MTSGAPPPAKKSLGQCFLTDQSYAQDIVAALQIEPDDLIIEIGPGRGFLTQQLVQSAAEIWAIELDDRLIEPLVKTFAERKNFRLLHQSVLDIDLATLLPVGRVVKIVGNLPYHLAAEILYMLFKHARVARHDLDLGWVTRAVLMIQREVADRVVAKPETKDWGKLSVFAQLEADVQMVTIVPATAFRPQPKVDGGVIQLDWLRLPPYYPHDFQLLERVLRWCFSHRRKMLKRSLSSLPGVHPFWQHCALDFRRRPETLTPQEWVQFCDCIAQAQQER